MWINTIFDAGTVKPDTTIIAKFCSSGKIAEALTYKLSCGCGSANWNPDIQLLSVNINVGEIPKHLTEYVVNKFVIVDYTIDNTPYQDILTINGLVKK